MVIFLTFEQSKKDMKSPTISAKSGENSAISYNL